MGSSGYLYQVNWIYAWKEWKCLKQHVIKILRGVKVKAGLRKITFRVQMSSRICCNKQTSFFSALRVEAAEEKKKHIVYTRPDFVNAFLVENEIRPLKKV